jgi:hypothetical protein
VITDRALGDQGLFQHIDSAPARKGEVRPFAIERLLASLNRLAKPQDGPIVECRSGIHWVSITPPKRRNSALTSGSGNGSGMYCKLLDVRYASDIMAADIDRFLALQNIMRPSRLPAAAGSTSR